MADDPLDDLELLPADDEGLSAEDDLAAAEASALEEEPPEGVPDPVEPFGRTWSFDYALGRFQRDGLAPREVRGRDALAEWCYAAMQTAQLTHPIFSANFGMERPDSVIGEAADVMEETTDWAARLEDALTVHDRVTSVENFDGDYDPDAGVVRVRQLDVLTDEENDETGVRFSGLTIGTVDA
jgi:hypothetical protein